MEATTTPGKTASNTGIIIIEGKPFKIAGSVPEARLKALGELLVKTGGKVDSSAGFETLLFVKGGAYVLVPK
jgi:hypothetical protein